MPQKSYVYPCLHPLHDVVQAFKIDNKKGLLTMTEEELKAKAEELEAKAAELERKETELKQKEEQLHATEEQLAKREAEAANIAATIKAEHEKKMQAQAQEYEERIRQRDEVIKQLASGTGQQPIDESSPFAELNRKRHLQKIA